MLSLPIAIVTTTTSSSTTTAAATAVIVATIFANPYVGNLSLKQDYD